MGVLQMYLPAAGRGWSGGSLAAAVGLAVLVAEAIVPTPAFAGDMDISDAPSALPGGAGSATPMFVAPAATPLFAGSVMADFAQTNGSSHERAVDCMAMAIAYEAGNQPIEGQQAVGQVILNRLRVARFPKSVCGVVFDGSARRTGCQFTFTCDGSIQRRLSDTRLLVAREVATAVLSGDAPDRVGGATHYHADYVQPYWADTGTRVTKIGAHIFYRMPGDAALAAPLALAAAAAEPVVAQMPRFGARRRNPGLARTTPAATRSMFAPWGLPVASAGQP